LSHRNFFFIFYTFVLELNFIWYVLGILVQVLCMALCAPMRILHASRIICKITSFLLESFLDISCLSMCGSIGSVLCSTDLLCLTPDLDTFSLLLFSCSCKLAPAVFPHHFNAPALTYALYKSMHPGFKIGLFPKNTFKFVKQYYVAK
jgi:hypothetical protein